VRGHSLLNSGRGRGGGTKGRPNDEIGLFSKRERAELEGVRAAEVATQTPPARYLRGGGEGERASKPRVVQQPAPHQRVVVYRPSIQYVEGLIEEGGGGGAKYKYCKTIAVQTPNNKRTAH
jgi:hypothetical protein